MSAGEAEGRLPFVGLTGGMAAGKTEALRALERLGAATISSDEIVHELLATDELRDLLVERFGERVAPGGSVDRSAVAEVAFDDPERTRNERAGARGHAGTESRTSRQLSQEEKAERANHVVENDGDLASLERKMADVLDAVTR
jgi:dephospho-CoA kinase